MRTDKIEVIFDKFNSFIESIRDKINSDDRLKALEIGKLINELRSDKDWFQKLINNPFEDIKVMKLMEKELFNSDGIFPIHPDIINYWSKYGGNYAERKNYINKRTNKRRLKKWRKYIQRASRIFRRR